MPPIFRDKYSVFENHMIESAHWIQLQKYKKSYFLFIRHFTKLREMCDNTISFDKKTFEMLESCQDLYKIIENVNDYIEMTRLKMEIVEKKMSSQVTSDIFPCFVATNACTFLQEWHEKQILSSMKDVLLAILKYPMNFYEWKMFEDTPKIYLKKAPSTNVYHGTKQFRAFIRDGKVTCVSQLDTGVEISPLTEEQELQLIENCMMTMLDFVGCATKNIGKYEFIGNDEELLNSLCIDCYVARNGEVIIKDVLPFGYWSKTYGNLLHWVDDKDVLYAKEVDTVPFYYWKRKSKDEKEQKTE